MFSKYWAILKTQLTNSLAYPADLAARSLTIVMFMWVFAHLWKATYGAATGCTNCQNQSIAGLTLRETLWYLMLAETIVLSTPRLSTAIANAVKDGSIAYLINKPYNFLLYQASVGLGESLVQMVFNLLAGGAVVWWLLGPPPDPRGWPMALVAIAIAWLINFCVSAMIGMLAFLTEEVAAFEWIYSKILYLLGGLFIPLDFFPGWLQAIAKVLPFAYTIYGPARLFVAPGLPAFTALLAGQLVWLSVLALAVALMYRKGVAWLSINGG